jgi:hypothetical protein
MCKIGILLGLRAKNSDQKTKCIFDANQIPFVKIRTDGKRGETEWYGKLFL